MSTTKICVALDWTPNTNHLGFFVAKFQGLYEAAGIEVEFLSPLDNNYDKTPRQRVETGEAHLGICPSETVISCHTADNARPAGERRRFTYVNMNPQRIFPC
jgi:ABC-type nitrate/sulfonate/bicarbonate transport system substrate-binding protein